MNFFLSSLLRNLKRFDLDDSNSDSKGLTGKVRTLFNLYKILANTSF